MCSELMYARAQESNGGTGAVRQRILIDRNVPILWRVQRDLREISDKIRLLSVEKMAHLVLAFGHTSIFSVVRFASIIE